jgi:hypothetical protein
MKYSVISYLVTAAAILILAFSHRFNWKFMDERDAKMILAGLSLALLYRIFILKRKLKG